MRSVRDRARDRFRARCGYCGVGDVDIGSTLTVDHHRPRSRGGGDDDEKLRLNREPLVAHRLQLRAVAMQREALDVARARVRELEQRISRMRADFDSTVEEIQRQTKTEE